MIQRRPGRSKDEWMELITQCRQSGLSDSAWCEQHDIPRSSFYNAVSRLRRKACAIPAPAENTRVALDLTAKQEVVKIDIVPDHAVQPVETAAPVPARQEIPEYIDNSHKIEIIMGPASIRIGNGAEPVLLETAIRTLRTVLC